MRGPGAGRGALGAREEAGVQGPGGEMIKLIIVLVVIVIVIVIVRVILIVIVIAIGVMI